MYSKIELFAFADFYHRWAQTGLSMEEMFENYLKYKLKPRDILDPIAYPGREKPKRVPEKPPLGMLQAVLNEASKLRGVSVQDVNSKCRKREFVTVRQMVAFVGINLGFLPKDFTLSLGWDRTGIYHKSRMALQFSKQEIDYRNDLNFLLEKFGSEPVIA